MRSPQIVATDVATAGFPRTSSLGRCHQVVDLVCSPRFNANKDQPDNRQIIRDMLAPTDYEIIEAEDGEQALSAIAKQRPDLILMDYPTADHGRLYGRKPD